MTKMGEDCTSTGKGMDSNLFDLPSKKAIVFNSVAFKIETPFISTGVNISSMVALA